MQPTCIIQNVVSCSSFDAANATSVSFWQLHQAAAAAVVLGRLTRVAQIVYFSSKQRVIRISRLWIFMYQNDVQLAAIVSCKRAVVVCVVGGAGKRRPSHRSVIQSTEISCLSSADGMCSVYAAAQSADSDRWVVGVWGDVSTLPFRLFENAKIDEWLDVSSALLITTEALKSPFCSV